MRFNTNTSSTDEATINNFKQMRDKVTIKPADKNLRIVLLNTDDYISQCTSHVRDVTTYRLANHYPTQDIKKTNNEHSHPLQATTLSVQQKVIWISFIRARPFQNTTILRIPKIYKTFTKLPPVRPIVSQCNSVPTPTAKFIDHALQPVAQLYPHYLHNSTSPLMLLWNLTVPDDAVLVRMYVSNLYPSIPQTDMLQTIYDEMCQHRHLLPFDPNLIIHLLHTNVNYNYFELASLIFQQVANLYMSVTIKRFLRTQSNRPHQIAQYINDIFIIWTHAEKELKKFIKDLNSCNPALQYTYQYSPTAVDYLDLTIYKSPLFTFTNIKTFQKPHNLYQYLHYTSNYQRAVCKGITIGELIWYVRTNSTEAMLKSLFVARLLSRGYPEPLSKT